MTTIFSLLHWIVATYGFVETLLVGLLVIVWLVYQIWNRRPNPPTGYQRWGIWLPALFCLEGLRSGIHEAWLVYGLMMDAGAFSPEQAQLFIFRATVGAIKLLSIGLLGTYLLLRTLRPVPRQAPAARHKEPWKQTELA